MRKEGPDEDPFVSLLIQEKEGEGEQGRGGSDRLLIIPSFNAREKFNSLSPSVTLCW